MEAKKPEACSIIVFLASGGSLILLTHCAFRKAVSFLRELDGVCVPHGLVAVALLDNYAQVFLRARPDFCAFRKTRWSERFSAFFMFSDLVRGLEIKQDT
uniref:Secreted protein n=1 Tax=Bursaphelenchus xylophilus TaxID=6326 RepID=A0A1I7STF6_BURXY